jgi:biotin carboxyl carrier protein
MTNAMAPGATSGGTLSGAVEAGAELARIRIESRGDNLFEAIFEDGSTLQLDLRHIDHPSHGVSHLTVAIEGKRESLLLTRTSGLEWLVDHAGVHRTLMLEEKKTRHAFQNAVAPQRPTANLLAPMPATIVEILVSEADVVDAGQPLLRIEAMKMVMTLPAAARQRIDALHVGLNDSVPAGHLLITFGEAG